MTVYSNRPHHAYALKLEKLQSFFYLFTTVHRTEQKAPLLELLMTALLLNTVPSGFARPAQPSHVLPSSTSHFCRYSYLQFIISTG